MPTKKKAAGKSKELAGWRDSHFAELEATLNVFKGIRDDPEASDKDRIEAGKSIGRMLSAMTPSRAAATPENTTINKQTLQKPELSPQLKEQLTRLREYGSTRP
jgi:hypothetical protein